MAKVYNQIAGGNHERIGGLADGVFAFAMTLIVFEIHVPLVEVIHSEQDLWQALVALAPRMETWLMSFMTLGIFWVGQQTGLNQLSRSDRHFSWIQLFFLTAVALMPFSTELLAEFIGFRVALLVYWFNIFVLGSVLLAGWIYACRAKLLKREVTEEIYNAVKRRIIVAQSLYAFGAALCLVNNHWSITFIILVQLNYVFAPRIPYIYELTA